MVQRCDLLPAEVLGHPGSLAPALPGVPGTDLFPTAGPAVVRATGAVAARPAAVRSFGTRAADGRFVALRERWTDEWRARVDRLAATAEAFGTTLGPPYDRMLGLLRDDLPALDGCAAFALVHGDLHPGNVLFDEAGVPTGIVDWDSAFAGDPLAEWGTALQLPIPTLAHFADGYGAEHVRAWLDDPGALARLGVYWRTRVLARIALAGLWTGHGGRERGVALEVGRQRLTEALRPVRERLSAALDAERGPVHVFAVPPGPALLARCALEALRHRPGATRLTAPLLVAVLGATELAARTPREVAARWGRIADRVLDLLGPQQQPQRWDPVPDRARWRRDLVARTLAAAGPPPCLALVVLALGLRAIDHLGDAVPDGVLRGLEELVALRLDLEAHARAGPPPGAAPRLAHALTGLLALRTLGPAPSLAEQLAEEARDALDLLVPVLPSERSDPTLPPASFAPGSEEEALLPAVRLAVVELGGALPVDAGTVLAATR